VVDRKDQLAARRSVLTHAYAVYGAAARRWPPAARRRLDELGEGGDAELAKVRSEARELDRLLDVAASPRVPAGAAERAIEAILSGEAQGAGSGDVVEVDFAAKAARGRHAFGLTALSSAAALAAALVLGIYFGASGLGDRLLPSATSSVTAANTDYDVVKHVLADLQEDMG